MAEPPEDVAWPDRPQGITHRRDEDVDGPCRRGPLRLLDYAEQSLDLPAIMPSKSAVWWPVSV
jgi:hypothetical protein